jgi:hypothetical protein
MPDERLRPEPQHTEPVIEPEIDPIFTALAELPPGLPDLSQVEASQVDLADHSPEAVAGAIALLNILAEGQRLPGVMNPQATRCLGALGIFTTQIPQAPVSRWRYFRSVAPTEHELEQLRANTLTQLLLARKESPEDLPPILASELAQATKPKIHDVHIEHAERHDGTVVLGRTTVSLPKLALAVRLRRTFQRLLAAERGKFCEIENGMDATGLPTLEIYDLTEFDERGVENGLWLQMAEWFERVTGTIFPHDKYTLGTLESMGHTFQPLIRQWLVQNRERRHRLAEGFEPTYSGFDDERQARQKRRDPLIHTIDPLFDLERSAINGAREEGYPNRETNPDPDAPILLIQQNIRLKREPTTPEKLRLGPPSPVAYSRFEEWKAEIYADAKAHHWGNLIVKALKIGGKAIGIFSGAIELAADLAQYIPGIKGKAQKHLETYHTWKTRKQKAAAALPTLIRARKILEQKQDELGHQPS